MDDLTGLHRPSWKESLHTMFVGKELDQLPTPVAVIDTAVVRRNCRRMLEACGALGVSFRPHIKTHKVIKFCLVLCGLTIGFPA